MAEDRRVGDILGQTGSDSNDSDSGNNNNNSSSTSGNSVETALLRSIDKSLKTMLQNGGMSQSDAKAAQSDKDKWKPNRTSQNGNRSNSSASNFSFDRAMKEFTDGLEEGLLESVLGSNFKTQMNNVMTNFAKSAGVQIKDVPKQFGKEFSKNILQSTKTGKTLTNAVQKTTSKAKDTFMSGVGKYADKQGLNKDDLVGTFKDMTKSPTEASQAEAASQAAASGMTDVESTAQAAQAASGAVNAAEGVAASGDVLGAALSGVSEVATMMGPQMLALVAGLVIADKALEAFGPAIEGTKKLIQGLGKSFNRYSESRKKNLEEEKKRIEADVRTLAEEPFNILKEAAQNLYDAWDNNVRKINQTQGYTKDDLYALMGQYAQRLRDDNLTSVVSTSDIMNNLGTVLEAGLSDQVAVEFAYLATKLNAAVPTQDFFEYASTYSSIAATAIKDGASQSEAIQYANEQLEQFASDLLYTNRQLTGGFSTGLVNASNIFQDAVKIAQAAKTNNSTQIAGVLTSVSGIIGELAPDLASELVDNVVSAAIGGNNSELVALRSLSGRNASNTEFLKMLAENPQELFSDIFYNLARYQNMAPDAYMEVAEGLSSVFGISMDALSRVDFNYLATAIAQMNTNSNSLEDNIKLLASGESTTTSEQLRMEQINKYMLDEGLSYVLDNEAARAIQQHMWDEQLAREIQEATYAVDLQGSALEFLQGIQQTVDNIVNLINPIAWIKKLGDLKATISERTAQSADVAQLLQLGQVGNGNARDFYNLTTTNQDLQLTSKLVDLMGGTSQYGAIEQQRKLRNILEVSQQFDSVLNDTNWVNTLKTIASNSMSSGPQSKYQWGIVSKAQAQAFEQSNTHQYYPGYGSSASRAATTANVQSNAMKHFQDYIDSIGTYINDAQKSGKSYSYEEWKATATKYGIKDVQAAMDSYGVSENDLKNQFASQEAAAGQAYNHEREKHEDEFWEHGVAFFLNTQSGWLDWENNIITNQVLTHEKLDSINDVLIAQLQDQKDIIDTNLIRLVPYLGTSPHMTVLSQLTNFIKAWKDYYISHTVYNKATGDAYKQYNNIQNSKASKEVKANDAVLALAQSLLNTKDASDPVVQSNVLLAKILLVVQAIMQQNNTVGDLSIPDALSALGLGIINQNKKK